MDVEAHIPLIVVRRQDEVVVGLWNRLGVVAADAVDLAQIERGLDRRGPARSKVATPRKSSAGKTTRPKA
jgi:hypothetical protein